MCDVPLASHLFVECVNPAVMCVRATYSTEVLVSCLALQQQHSYCT
jgi:hypothetical protein